MLTLRKSIECRCTNEGSEIGAGERMKSPKTVQTLLGNKPLINQASGLEEKFLALKGRHARKTLYQILHVVPLCLPPRLHIPPIYTPSPRTPTLRTPTIHSSLYHTPTLHSSSLHTSTQVWRAEIPLSSPLNPYPIHTSEWESQLP